MQNKELIFINLYEELIELRNFLRDNVVSSDNKRISEIDIKQNNIFTQELIQELRQSISNLYKLFNDVEQKLIADNEQLIYLYRILGDILEIAIDSLYSIETKFTKCLYSTNNKDAVMLRSLVNKISKAEYYEKIANLIKSYQEEEES